MLITNIFLSGGAIYAYLKQRRNPPAAEIVTNDHNEVALQQHAEAAQHYTAVSSVALGMSLVGSFVSSPLVYLSVPLNVYTNLPLFEEGIKTLGGNDDRFGSIMNSLIVSGMLASNHVLTANIIDWVTQRSRLTGARLRQSGYEAAHIFSEGANSWISQAMGRTPETIWLATEQAEMEIPFAELQIGDTVLFREGAIVSVAGEIVRGEAKMFDLTLLRHPPIMRMVGDHVTPRMMVLNGILFVRVERIP